jgi:glycosyltransferase involved in cell wall biosynthesis
VVLPTYDRLPLLREAVASVLAQTVSDLELVVVDNGSTDGTREYLAGLRDPRLRAVTTERLFTAGRARNAGLAAARGRLIAFLDSDDLWAKAKLERQLEALARSPTALWSSTAIGMIDAAGVPLALAAGSVAPPRSGWVFEELLFDRASAALQGVLADAALVREAGGFDDETFREDFDFVLRLAERSEVAAVDEPLAFVREHAGRAARQERDVAELLRRFYDRLLARTVDPARRRLCVRRYAMALADVAEREGARGHHAAGRAALASAWRLDPRAPAVWRASARVAAYGLLVRSAGGRSAGGRGADGPGGGRGMR